MSGAQGPRDMYAPPPTAVSQHPQRQGGWALPQAQPGVGELSYVHVKYRPRAPNYRSPLTAHGVPTPSRRPRDHVASVRGSCSLLQHSARHGISHCSRAGCRTPHSRCWLPRLDEKRHTRDDTRTKTKTGTFTATSHTLSARPFPAAGVERYGARRVLEAHATKIGCNIVPPGVL